MKRIISALALLTVLQSAKAQKNIFFSKAWVFEIISVGGTMIDPNIQTEPIVRPTQYRIFLQPTRYGAKINAATLYLKKGMYYSVTFAPKDQLETILPDGQKLLQTPTKYLSGGNVTVAVDFVQLPKAVTSYFSTNEAVISFMVKGKEYFMPIKTMVKKEIALP